MTCHIVLKCKQYPQYKQALKKVSRKTVTSRHQLPSKSWLKLRLKRLERRSLATPAQPLFDPLSLASESLEHLKDLRDLMVYNPLNRATRPQHVVGQSQVVNNYNQPSTSGVRHQSNTPKLKPQKNHYISAGKPAVMRHVNMFHSSGQRLG